ncbi:MAG: radical SAM protein, partial [Sulfurovaceae bacterium]|nr:radical SAM protein [Sulfurovaceae bacterium]
MRFVLQWHLTERCNLRCTHCYQNEAIIKDELSLEENFMVVDKFVAFIKTLNKDSYSRGVLNITGGEPFVYKDLEPLLAYISQFKEYLSFNFLSNGTLINDKTIALIKKYKPLFVQISIDGDKTSHDRIRGAGAFETSMKGIKRLKENGVKVIVSFT